MDRAADGADETESLTSDGFRRRSTQKSQNTQKHIKEVSAGSAISAVNVLFQTSDFKLSKERLTGARGVEAERGEADEQRERQH